MSIYGNPVTLGPRWLTAKKVSILPFQNLHGYDHPWPAGGGKNLFDDDSADFKVGYFLNSSGTEESNAAYRYTQNYIDILPSTTYCLQAYNGSGNVACTVCLYDSNKTFLERVFAYHVSPGVGIKSGSFTTPASAHYIRFSLSLTASNIMLEIASSASSYEPYSNICPISGWEDCRVWVSPTPDPADGTTYQMVFGNPPGTVYGGERNLETGVLTVDRAMVDLGTLNWTRQEPTASYPFGCFTSVDLSGRKPGQHNILCSCYPVGNVKTDKSIVGNASSVRLYVVDSSYTDAATFTTAMSGVQLVYELATPITIQLTPQQISFLHNQYFGANCGPVLIKIGKQ